MGVFKNAMLGRSAFFSFCQYFLRKNFRLSQVRIKIYSPIDAGLKVAKNIKPWAAVQKLLSMFQDTVEKLGFVPLSIAA